MTEHELLETDENMITEWCSHCGKETELRNEFRPQVCDCGTPILPCTLCVRCTAFSGCPLKIDYSHMPTRLLADSITGDLPGEVYE